MSELRKAQLGAIPQSTPLDASALAAHIQSASGALLGKEQKRAEKVIAQAAVEKQLAANEGRFEAGEGEVLFDIATPDDLKRVGRRYRDTFEAAAKNVAMSDIQSQAAAEIQRMHNEFITNPERDSKAFAADSLRVVQAVEDQFSKLGLRSSEAATEALANLNGLVNESYQKVTQMQSNIELNVLRSRSRSIADDRLAQIRDLGPTLVESGKSVKEVRAALDKAIEKEELKRQHEISMTLLPGGYERKVHDTVYEDAADAFVDRARDIRGDAGARYFFEKYVNPGKWYRDKSDIRHIELREKMKSGFKKATLERIKAFMRAVDRNPHSTSRQSPGFDPNFESTDSLKKFVKGEFAAGRIDPSDADLFAAWLQDADNMLKIASTSNNATLKEMESATFESLQLGQGHSSNTSLIQTNIEEMNDKARSIRESDRPHALMDAAYLVADRRRATGPWAMNEDGTNPVGDYLGMFNHIDQHVRAAISAEHPTPEQLRIQGALAGGNEVDLQGFVIGEWVTYTAKNLQEDLRLAQNKLRDDPEALAHLRIGIPPSEADKWATSLDTFLREGNTERHVYLTDAIQSLGAELGLTGTDAVYEALDAAPKSAFPHGSFLRAHDEIATTNPQLAAQMYRASTAGVSGVPEELVDAIMPGIAVLQRMPDVDVGEVAQMFGMRVEDSQGIYTLVEDLYKGFLAVSPSVSDQSIGVLGDPVQKAANFAANKVKEIFDELDARTVTLHNGRKALLSEHVKSNVDDATLSFLTSRAVGFFQSYGTKLTNTVNIQDVGIVSDGGQIRLVNTRYPKSSPNYYIRWQSADVIPTDEAIGTVTRRPGDVTLVREGQYPIVAFEVAEDD